MVILSRISFFHLMNAFKKHCQRANYQACIWQHSLDCNLEEPSPAGDGCQCEGDMLYMDWMDALPVPQAVLVCLPVTVPRNVMRESAYALSAT